MHQRMTVFGLCLTILFAGCASRAPVLPEPCIGDALTLPVNEALLADAGPDFEAKPGADVRLNATLSRGIEPGPPTVHWRQVEGPCAAFDDSAPLTPIVAVPKAAPAGTVLIFELVVVENGEKSPLDQTEIVVI